MKVIEAQNEIDMWIDPVLTVLNRGGVIAYPTETIYGIGGDHERAHGSIRFSLGRYNTVQDADAVVDAIAEIVRDLREISPLGKDSGVKEE